MTGPSEACVSAAAAATCCHWTLLWKPDAGSFAIREEGRRSALVAGREDMRIDCEDKAAVRRLRGSAAGHLRSAANIVDAELRTVDID